MIFSELSDRGAGARLVALEKRLVEVYFRPFFFDGVFAGAFFAFVVFDALAMPSDSERLSSMSTVCVTASVAVLSAAGWAVAGAMVWVVGCERDPAFWRPQATGRSAANIRSRMVFFTCA